MWVKTVEYKLHTVALELYWADFSEFVLLIYISLLHFRKYTALPRVQKILTQCMGTVNEATANSWLILI